MATISPYIGFLLLDSRFNPNNEAAQGVGADDSSYTQAGPVPGTAELDDELSLWKPAITGYQSNDVRVTCVRGGFPGRDGAAVIYRLATTEEWRGWDEPNVVAGWSAPVTGYTPATSWGQFSAVTIPHSQVVVVAAWQFDGGLRIFRYDPRAETWAEGFYFDPADGWELDNPPMLAWDPVAGRLLLFVGGGVGDTHALGFFSDDDGDTWELYAQGVWPEPGGAFGPATIAVQPREAWVCIRDGGGSPTGYAQFSSIDAGQTWSLVEGQLSLFHAAPGRQHDVVALPGGGYLLAYLTESDSGTLVARRLATADSPITAQAEIDIGGVTTYTSVAAAVDADGVVYVFAVRDGCAIDVFRSIDEGLTWERYDWGVVTGNGARTPTYVLEGAVAAGGQVHLVHTASDATLALDPWGLLHLGGWTSVEAGSGALSELRRAGRSGAGDYVGDFGGTVSDARAWLPIDNPLDMGWTPSVLGGTFSLANGPWGDLQTTANGLGYAYSWSTATKLVRGSGEVEFVSGGATYEGVGMEVQVGDGTVSFHVQFQVTSDRVIVFDMSGAGEIEHLLIDTTAGIKMRWILATDDAGGAKVSCWVRPLGTTEWTAVCDKADVGDDGAGTFKSGAWGHIDNGTARSRWRSVTITPYGDWQAGIDTPVERASAESNVYTLGHMGLSWGRPTPASSAEAYPLPEATDTGENVGRIAARGRARKGEFALLPTSYVHGMRLASPAVASHPARYWESAGATEQKVVYDLGTPQWMGGAIGLALVATEGRTWALECDDGAGGWETLATADLALGEGLLTTRTGSVLVPRAGTDAIGEYLGENRLVGHYAILSTTGSPVARRIVRSSAGWFTDSTDVQQVRITVEGIDGTEQTNGTCTIVAPGGVLVYYPTAEKIRRRWRWVAAASQVTPSGKVRAGVVGIGRVAAIGAEPGWDWSRRREFVRSVTRDSSQSPTVKRRGNPRTLWSYAWPDVVDLYPLRAGIADKVAITGGLPIGSAEDAWHSLWGWMEHEMQSGQMPAVLLVSLPQETTTILDPSLWAYGVLMVDSHGVTGIRGREGEDEAVRLEAPTFEELRA